MSERIQLDSLVEGTAGVTPRRVRGRVFNIARSGAVAIIGTDGKQWMIYEPELVDKPRNLISRTDIPARLR